MFQSGQPWEAQSYEPYRSLTTSTSDTNRNAEPAGSRRTDSHWQMDLNYTQNIRLGDRLNLQLVADLFNVFDNQTGYNFEPQVHNSLFNTPRNFFDPRRLQVAARVCSSSGRALSLAISGRVVASARCRAASIRAARSGSWSSTLTCARLKSAIG